MPTPRLYHDLAWLWPRLSPPEHYAAEAALLRRIMMDHLGEIGRRPTVLELGAGGGHTLTHLTDTCDCVAIDLSEPMLANCRELNPTVETIVGDMRGVRLGRAFDAVLVHDAVDYLTTPADVAGAMRTIAAHLAPAVPGGIPGAEAGGIAFIAPTYTRETFTDGEVADDGTTTDSEELTYFTYVHDPDPADDTFEMILLYLIRDRDTGRVTVEEDRHTCGLFSAARWARMIETAGLKLVAPGRALATDAGGPWNLFTAVAG